MYGTFTYFYHIASKGRSARRSALRAERLLLFKQLVDDTVTKAEAATGHLPRFYKRGTWGDTNGAAPRELANLVMSKWFHIWVFTGMIYWDNIGI